MSCAVVLLVPLLEQSRRSYGNKSPYHFQYHLAILCYLATLVAALRFASFSNLLHAPPLKIRTLREKQADIGDDEPEEADQVFFEEQLVENRVELQQIIEQRNDLVEQESAKRKEEKAVKDQLERFKIEAEQLLQDQDEKIAEMEKFEHSVTRTQSKIDGYRKTLRECNEIEAELKVEVSVRDRAIVAERQTAEQLKVEYIETERGEDSTTLNKRIKALDERIKVEEKLRGDEAQITADYYDKKTAYENARKYAIALEKLQDKLKDAILNRSDALHEFRLRLASRTKYQFDFMLRYRDFEGTLTFNHDNSTLSMQVDPIRDTGSQALSAANSASGHTSSLSGGERSFSTICFILALWEAMDCKAVNSTSSSCLSVREYRVLWYYSAVASACAP